MQVNIDELELLLPFYANGTLSVGERDLVDATLTQSEALRTSLAEIVVLANRVKADSLAFVEGGTSQNSQLENVLSRIDALPTGQMASGRIALDQMAQIKTDQGQNPRRAPPQSLRARLAFLSPRRWHPAVSLCLAIAVIAQSAMLMSASLGQRALETSIAARDKQVKDLEFQLASGQGTQTAGANLVIQLDKDASWREVEAILAGENLKIVDGPQDGTLTLLSVETGVKLDAVIGRLRASPLIASADKAL